MPKTGKAEFDEFATSYDTAVNKSLAFSGLKVDLFTRIKADYLADVMSEDFAHPSKIDVLDVGCGVGNIHPYLANRIASLSGVDVSEDCIQTAKERNPTVSYLSYDGNTLPYGDASFDFVYTICVMHHVQPGLWDRFASEMCRVLRPRGVALVLEHNPWNPLTRHAVSSCEFDKDAVLLKAGTTESLLARAGLKDVKTRFIAVFPSTGRLVRRFEGALSHIPIGAQYYTRGRL